MAEFLDLNVGHPRGKKGEYVDPRNEIRILHDTQVDRELIKRFRFHDDGIKYIASLIAEHDLIRPKHGQKGTPVPLELQVAFVEIFSS